MLTRYINITIKTVERLINYFILKSFMFHYESKIFEKGGQPTENKPEIWNTGKRL